MARVDVLTTNFSAGEISPLLYGRPDIAKYNDAVKRGRDVVFLQHGGVRGRPGTRQVGEVKDSGDLTRIIPFVYNASDAYILEWGDGYCRVWRDDEMVHEFATSYDTSIVHDLDYSQGADTMLLALQIAFPRRLQRWSDTRWTLTNAPMDPAPYKEVGFTGNHTITLGATTGSTSMLAASATFLASDVGRQFQCLGGTGEITAVADSTHATLSVDTTFDAVLCAANTWRIAGTPQTGCTPSAKEPVGAEITLTLGAAGWRTADVGKHVEINGGLVEIIDFTSTTIVDAVIKTALAADIEAVANSWVLQGDAWNSVDGFPKTVSFHEQRAVFANTPAYPQTVWGSNIGLYLDFTRGTTDDASYSFELSSDEVNPIQFLNSARSLAALTSQAAWTLVGSVEKPITPTNIRAIPQSDAGAADVRPEQIGDGLYYVLNEDRRLQLLNYSTELAAYEQVEAGAFSEHIARDIAEITWARVPNRVAWMRRTDGTFLGVTISREQNIRAFSLNTLVGGFVESTATIPMGGERVTYMVVRRTINGQTKRYIEKLDWETYQDCAITITNSPASATVEGLDHLEGLTVSAVADDIDLGDFTVAAGAITLPRVASVVDVGIRFVPTVKLLQPETGTGMGASLGQNTMTGKSAVLFHETLGCTVNGQPLDFRSFPATLDEAIPPFSGWKDISDFGWSDDSGEVELTQPQSYPWCLLAVRRRVTANPG